MKRPQRAIARRLADSERRLHNVRGTAQEILEKAEEMEQQAIRDVRRLRNVVRRSTGPKRQIAEAEYMDALDRRTRAAQVGGMSRVTRENIGPATPLGRT